MTVGGPRGPVPKRPEERRRRNLESKRRPSHLSSALDLRRVDIGGAASCLERRREVIGLVRGRYGATLYQFTGPKRGDRNCYSVELYVPCA
jgi:hypothetical protein